MNVAETALPTRGHNRPRNPGAPLAPDWFESVGVNASAVERRAATLTTRRSVKKEWQAAWLVKAMTCIDLTTLSGDDTPGRVRRLCAKARRPLSDELIEALDLAQMGLTVAAVCVYPIMVGPAVKALKGSGIPVASVTIGFPAGIPGSSIGRIRRLRLQREKTSPARENRFVRDAAIESPRLIRMSSEQGSKSRTFRAETVPWGASQVIGLR